MMQFKKHLFLVRHGETEFNKKEIIQGHVDSRLTDLGHEQIRQIAEKAKELDIDVLISSDLRRAEETAKVISKAIRIPITKIDPIFRERYYTNA